ncbi:hypothetical protein A3L04_06860 [Thermococcus chitonophagus]|uniref:Uncharacterized protein n=1 Tax=Thermococcus chitonophagus TaxID=54262 RepID=A0A160VT52_9EURY|nr:hypothetical protein [Thermococcus chitonophagus]ASJ16815.1 hypothetical protein A3L04_06860 [Thermococcus chitonophagus]CUX78287.1 hypothetical protein CHITON_1508 [Thermococcus chitonophagus]
MDKIRGFILIILLISFVMATVFTERILYVTISVDTPVLWLSGQNTTQTEVDLRDYNTTAIIYANSTFQRVERSAVFADTFDSDPFVSGALINVTCAWQYNSTGKFVYITQTSSPTGSGECIAYVPKQILGSPIFIGVVSSILDGYGYSDVVLLNSTFDGLYAYGIYRNINGSALYDNFTLNIDGRYSEVYGTIIVTATGAGTITSNGVTLYSVSPGDVVEFDISDYHDGSTGTGYFALWINNYDGTLSFTDIYVISVKVNGNVVATNMDVNASFTVDLTNIVSNLTIHVNSTPAGWTQLDWAGSSIIYGTDNSEIYIYNTSASPSRELNFAPQSGGSSAYYAALATGVSVNGTLYGGSASVVSGGEIRRYNGTWTTLNSTYYNISTGNWYSMLGNYSLGDHSLKVNGTLIVGPVYDNVISPTYAAIGSYYLSGTLNVSFDNLIITVNKSPEYVYFTNLPPNWSVSILVEVGTTQYNVSSATVDSSGVAKVPISLPAIISCPTGNPKDCTFIVNGTSLGGTVYIKIADQYGNTVTLWNPPDNTVIGGDVYAFKSELISLDIWSEPAQSVSLWLKLVSTNCSGFEWFKFRAWIENTSERTSEILIEGGVTLNDTTTYLQTSASSTTIIGYIKLEAYVVPGFTCEVTLNQYYNFSAPGVFGGNRVYLEIKGS